MNLQSEFKFGDSVYFKTDPHQYEFLVTGILFRPSGVIYYASTGGQEERAYGFELSTEKTVF